MGKLLLVFLYIFSAVVCGQSSNLNSNSNPNPGECEIPEEFQKKMEELEKFQEEFKELKSALVDLSAAFIRFSQHLVKNKTGETGPAQTPVTSRNFPNSNVKTNANAKSTTVLINTVAEKLSPNKSHPKPAGTNVKIVNGEKVIVAPEISCREQNGLWEKLQVCPPSKIVTAHRFRHLSWVRLTGIQLKCTEKYGDERQHEHILLIDFEAQVERNQPRGEWENWKTGSRSAFAEGFSFSRDQINLTCSGTKPDLIYHNKNQTVDLELDSDSTRVVTTCPKDHAICGVTAMMDKAGRGILTLIGLKCCHHCFPEEKWETIHQFNNTGDSEEQKNINTTVGLQRSLRNSADQITHEVLHESFSTRFRNFRTNSNSSSTGFDWSATSYLIWIKETMVTHTYTCQAQSSCVYKQLVGQCGSVRVPVPKFCMVSAPIGSSVPDSCNFNPPPESESDAELESEYEYEVE